MEPWLKSHQEELMLKERSRVNQLISVLVELTTFRCFKCRTVGHELWQQSGGTFAWNNPSMQLQQVMQPGSECGIFLESFSALGNTLHDVKYCLFLSVFGFERGRFWLHFLFSQIIVSGSILLATGIYPTLLWVSGEEVDQSINQSVCPSIHLSVWLIIIQKWPRNNWERQVFCHNAKNA